jgi:glycosyltransferase involved in cell wall biosynthesis
VKDHHTFLRAAAMVSRAFPTTRFAVFGDGPLRTELVAQAASLGLAERVTFFGTQQGVANCLSACDVLVSTSLVEGLSNAILEAMGLGVPVIATDIPGNREIVLAGQTGWLVPVRSPDVLAATIERIFTRTSEVAACVAQAKEMVATRFGLDRMIDEHVALYESLLAGQLRPALAPGA